MENILRLIYNKSIKNEILNNNDIDKILSFLVINKDLNNYILNIDVQPIRSNKVASYSSYTKRITIYSKTIEKLILNIEKNIINATDFDIALYKNLSILQVILHEVEHANQQKIAFSENNLEAFILRMSFLIKNAYEDQLYEYCPEERLAEIKSYEDLILMIQYLNNKTSNISSILDAEKLQRLLRGYHYKDEKVEAPLTTYFFLANKIELIQNIKLDNDDLEERMRFGYSISNNEYGDSMNKLILSLNKNFRNRINIK